MGQIYSTLGLYMYFCTPVYVFSQVINNLVLPDILVQLNCSYFLLKFYTNGINKTQRVTDISLCA